jgi:2'-5' RNA ligase
MRYLVHITPSKEICDEMECLRNDIKQYTRKVPKLAHHCTISVGNFQEQDEKQMVQALEEMIQEKFIAKFNQLDLFAEDALVARLEVSPALQNLHVKAAIALRQYMQIGSVDGIPELYKGDAKRLSSFYTYGSIYSGEFYQPHTTICEVFPESAGDIFLKHSRRFFGMAWEVQEFVLSKKETSWNAVHTFPLK